MTGATQSKEEREYSDDFEEAAAKKATADEAGDDEVELELDAEAKEAADADDAARAASQGNQQGEPVDLEAKIRAQNEQIAQLNHRIRSDDGRVNAYQRQVNELSQALQAAKESASAAPVSKAQPTEQEITYAMSGGEDIWSQFSEEYPDVAKAIDARLERGAHAVEEKLDQKIEGRLAPVEQYRAEEEQLRGYEYLDNVHTGWRDRVNSQIFADWIEAQPDVIQALADSDDVNEASSLINNYDNYLLATGKMSAFNQPDGGNRPPGDANTDAASDLKAKRERQLSDGDAIASRGAGVSADSSPEPGFSSAFKAYAKRKAQEARDYR